MPANLFEALEELKKDTFLCEVLGDHLVKRYVDAKMEEWNRYRAFVSQWEIDEYLYKY